MRGSAGEVHTAVAAGCQDRAMGMEAVQGPVLHVPGEQAAAGAVLVHQQVECDVFDEELSVVLQALLVKRVQDGVTGPVGRRASALCHLLPVFEGLAAKRTLIASAVCRARERN